ncbi:MAG: PQQ-binding-like beta-propeller repeat protein [Anaerolineales bacterium]|nr:PQQ-binding-like beta-propeller repeat protein [Anaerolineales bacterium]
MKPIPTIPISLRAGSRKVSISLVLLLGGLLLSACTGAASTASSWPGLTVDGDTAYLAYNQHVYAINLGNGSEKWRFPAEGNARLSFFAPPVLTPDGQLLAGSYSNVLYSIDPKNGQQKWEFKEAKNRYVGSPLVTEKGIFAPTASEELYHLNLEGNLQWTFTTEGPQWSQPVADPDCTCIYVGSMDHYLYAINAETGMQEWRSEKLSGSIVGTPTLSPEGVLYVGTFNKEMIAIDAKSGKTVWRSPTSGWVWSGPVLKEGSLYFGDINGTFYHLNAADGSVTWSIKPDGPIIGAPFVDEERIYFGTENGTLLAIDLNGNTLWTATFSGKIYTAPVRVGDRILVAPFGTKEILVAVDLSGAQVWSFTPETKK